ncbi:MAG: uncharacterized protein PWP46_418 [Fusobacteriaceae bacterium]|jgi:FtsH-binding integral membrane protein|nr:hypothetical protein [Fusobacteriales bacterium]MDN5303539.1 uncharacterized protein [Fusobacteriaceae bacterium]
MYGFNGGGYYNVSEKVMANTISKILTWMVAGLLITFGVAFSIMTNPGMAMVVSRSFLLLVIAQFGVVVAMSGMVKKISVQTAKILFVVYSALTGATLSLLMLFFSTASIIYALIITVVIFSVMAIYGYTTKEDLSKFGSLLRVGIIALIVLSLVNMFFRTAAIYWMVSYLGVLIFIGFIGYDMNTIKNNLLVMSNGDEELIERFSVFGALMLYLDFINLFIYILRIVGLRRDD